MPAISEDEVLVRVRAASIHVGDWILMTGTPYVMRVMTGLSKPKIRVPGTDVAGTVEAVGTQVQEPPARGWVWLVRRRLRRVRARNRGSVRHETGQPHVRTGGRRRRVRQHCAPAPSRRRERAARAEGPDQRCVGWGRDIRRADRRAFGADVTGVCSTKNLELVRSIGADHVIDYSQEDFRAGAERYDVILDNVGDRSMADTRRALTPTGRLLSNGGGHSAGKLGRVIRASSSP